MQLRFGAYLFPANATSVTSHTTVTPNAAGRPVERTVVVDVEFALNGTGQAQLSAAEILVARALAIPYQDLVFLTDTGAISGTRLLNAGSVSGVRVTDGPHFLNRYSGAEYQSTRSGVFRAEATYPDPAAGTALVSFTETISVIGTGGPLVRYRNAINAPPQRQIIYPNTVVRATQTGQSVGYSTYPRVPPPFYPLFEVFDQRAVSRDTPSFRGLKYTAYPVSWAYVFESPLPLSAVPNLWTG